MNTALLLKNVRKYLLQEIGSDASTLVLKGSPFKVISTQELAQQLVGLQKSKSKLPTWFENPQVLYPPKVNLEQTSSEITATYKANLVSGSYLIDTTGGFGIDTYHFSNRIDNVIHCELNSELSKLTQHNAEALGKKNISFHNGDAIDYLQQTETHFDWIYSDPSRRNSSGGKVFKLSDCEPNIPEHLEFLFSKSDKILLKTSPLLDISAGLKELKNVTEIHIIAIDNDVKELLWILNKAEATVETLIKTVNIKSNSTEAFETTLEANYTTETNYSLPQTYIYEPNAAIMKSGLFGSLAEKLQLNKLHQHSHLYTSEKLIDFPGRRFKVSEVIPFQKKNLKRRFKNLKANITTRNFPMTAPQLKTMLQNKDGGDVYLFFTTTFNEEKVCLVCGKI